MRRSAAKREQGQQGDERTGWRSPVRSALVWLAPRLVATEHRRLALLLLAATALRLPWLLTPGYDVAGYKLWAWVVNDAGIGGAYSATYPPHIPAYHYPPLYLYLLRTAGLLYTALHPAGSWDDQTLAALLKVWPVAAEIALGLVLYRFVRRHRPSPWLALGATAAYLLNPAIIWNTAYWGGIDAVPALFLAAALFAATEDRPTRAWPLATLAVGAKLFVLPGALATVPPALRGGGAPGYRHRRADTPVPGAGYQAQGEPAAARGGVWSLALAAVGALATGVLLCLPLLLRGQFGALVGVMFGNLGHSPVLSANAHNLWWLVTVGDGWRSDTAALAPGLTPRGAGLILFAGCAAWALYRLWRRGGDAATICGTSAFLQFAVVMLMTEVHENWAFALFAPLVATAALCPRYRPLYAALSLTFLANLALHDPPLQQLLGPGPAGAMGRLGLLNAAAQCALFGWWGWALLRET